MKFICNNRDKVFWSFFALWLFLGSTLKLFNIKPIIIHGIAIGLFSIIVLLDNTNDKFSNWLDIKAKTRKYKLTSEEAILWDSIQQKAVQGYNEFVDECKKDDKYYGWPWMSPNLITEERTLVDKIHEYFYPGDYIADPIGVAQADYAWYSDIKNKVIYV